MNAVDEDVQRMLAFRQGDDAAFDALFQRWAGPLLRYIDRMLRDRATAEELVQETFLRVYRARDSYRPEARFSTWLYRIGTNLALNELRRPRHRDAHESLDAEGAAPLGPPLTDAGPDAADLVDARRRSAAVEDALAGLPERQRAALLLCSLEGRSYAEIAETLDVSEKAVKALVHRARRNLAASLAGQDAQGAGEEER